MLLKIKTIRHSYRKVPVNIRGFFKKALILLFGWLILYHMLLVPLDIPDRWLTRVNTDIAAKLLSLKYPADLLIKDNSCFISMNNKSILWVSNGCNALELYVLYLGFLLCVPTTAKRFFLFAAAGIATIFSLNVLRIAALALIAWKSPKYMDFAHHYAFTLIVYSFIFVGWILYSKRYEAKLG